MRLFLLLLALAASVAMSAASSAAEPDIVAHCARVRDDDTVRPSPLPLVSWPALVGAYSRLMHHPASPDLPPEQTALRCMDGRVMACWYGANLPCGKISTARENPGATNWCKEHPGTPPPMAATGHGVLYSYRCNGNRAQIDGTNWTLDRRGFAKELWTPVN